MANRKRRIAKSRKVITKEQQSAKLYKETLKLVQKSNARLDSLQRHYKLGTWSSKKLMNRLDTNILKAWSIKGKIKLNNNLTNTQLKAIQKATKQFLESKTSTNKGIKSVKESTKESLKNSLSLDNELDDEDVEEMYNMLSNNDFDYFNEKVGASTMWVIIDDAIEQNDSEEGFLERIERYAMTLNDLDVKEKARRLYEKYVV